MTAPIPLTLTIIPTNISKPPVLPIPNFQYAPLIPEIQQVKAPLKDGALEEKEQRRLRKQRERNQRYQDKIRMYNKLAALRSDKDKFYELLLLCQPSLIYRDKSVIEEKITAFLNDVGV